MNLYRYQQSVKKLKKIKTESSLQLLVTIQILENNTTNNWLDIIKKKLERFFSGNLFPDAADIIKNTILIINHHCNPAPHFEQSITISYSVEIFLVECIKLDQWPLKIILDPILRAIKCQRRKSNFKALGAIIVWSIL